MSIKKLALLFAILVATCLGATTGHAVSARTWVSNTGNDSNPCSVTQPCLTFAGALANTLIGGEINCLTPGGFGAVTISVSVTIDCEGASNGGVQLATGDAITINTAGIVVTLIGLDLDGENQAEGGVAISAPATVNIRNCKIYGFFYGIDFVTNASGGSLVVDNVFLANNTFAILQNSTGGASNMSVRNSNISNNSTYGIHVQVSGGTHAGATIEQTTLAFNTVNGLLVQDTGAIALIGGSTVVNNGVGVAAQSGGTVYSFKNNQIGGNGTDISGTITAYPGGLN
jgi:hypothetical protein